MKYLTGALVAMSLICNPALAEEDRCRPGAVLAEHVAKKREAGKNDGTALKELESEGRIDSQGDGGIFEAAIVVWVYRHEVGSKEAYEKFYAECKQATSS